MITIAPQAPPSGCRLDLWLIGVQVLRPVVERTCDDGGYHAIKGFAYQFDASLLKVFDDPRAMVELEGKQDLTIEDYHIQVKNRSGNFSLSAIGPAIRQMVEQFMSDASSRFCLRCHFPDQPPGSERYLTVDELDALLAHPKFTIEVDEATREKFAQACVISFSSNYEEQFQQVIREIKGKFSARDEVESVGYHAILHAYLRDNIISQPKGSRIVNLADLQRAVHEARSAIFESAYVSHLGYERYIRAVRKQYTFRSVNVPRRERIFCFECNSESDAEEIAEVALALRDRYSVRSDCPAPYIAFRGSCELGTIKESLWGSGAYFNDGCGYSGGKFRMDHLIAPPAWEAGIKIIDVERISQLLGRLRVAEYHDVYLTEKAEKPQSISRSSHVFLRAIEDMLQIL